MITVSTLQSDVVFLIIGATIGRPSFIKVSLCFARTTNGRPYRFGGGFDVVIVGTGVLDGPKGRFVNRPYRC